MRTLLAYLLAPAVPGVLFAILSFPTGISDMVQTFAATSIVSYPFSWTVGTVGFLALRKMEKEKIKHYALTGGISGALIIITLMIGLEFSLELLIPIALYAVLGSSVAVTFIAIRGRRKSIQSQRSTHLSRPVF